MLDGTPSENKYDDNKNKNDDDGYYDDDKISSTESRLYSTVHIWSGLRYKINMYFE